MPTIRIDDEVYSWLKSQAIPFEDTPNSVLRRFAGLTEQKPNIDQDLKDKGEEGQKMTVSTNISRRLTGKLLKKMLNVDVKHALYHHEGTFYENLRDFPGALFDTNGYVIFKTEKEYVNSPYLDIGKKLNVHRGISTIPGYKVVRQK